MKSIVVVDDSSFGRELLALALQRSGFETVTAASGLDALPLIQRRKPHLIILTLKLPEMEGLKTLRRIRGMPQMRDIPVFMLSEKDNRACVVQATQIGIQAYILKSQFTLEAFLKRVQDQIGTPNAVAPRAAPAEQVWGAIT
jgi:CheY-like chemotaxis protein